jgi:hypothetical protein
VCTVSNAELQIPCHAADVFRKLNISAALKEKISLPLAYYDNLGCQDLGVLARLSYLYCSIEKKRTLKIEFLPNHKTSVRTSQETRLRYKDQPVNAVYCESHTKHTDTLCGQNADF